MVVGGGVADVQIALDLTGLGYKVYLFGRSGAIGGVVNVSGVAEHAKSLPNVAYASGNLYSCSQDAQKILVETIHKHKLNRLVVAACTTRTHEPLFQAILREAGLNRSLFEMVNIRDQCSWVHIHEPEAATDKVKDAVCMAVAKSCHLSSLTDQQLLVTPSALVVGGGLAGRSAGPGHCRSKALW